MKKILGKGEKNNSVNIAKHAKMNEAMERFGEIRKMRKKNRTLMK